MKNAAISRSEKCMNSGRAGRRVQISFVIYFCPHPSLPWDKLHSDLLFRRLKPHVQRLILLFFAFFPELFVVAHICKNQQKTAKLYTCFSYPENARMRFLFCPLFPQKITVQKLFGMFSIIVAKTEVLQIINIVI